MGNIHTIEYICTYCGKRTLRSSISGRPYPDNCPRKPKNKDGSMKPHTWRISRVIK